MKSLTLERGSRWLRKQMAHFRLPGAHHPGALFHMLLVPSWMPSLMLHSWFLNPPAEPAKTIKRAVSFIFSTLLNWLSVGMIHLPSKHTHPSAVHLEKGIVWMKESASKDEMVLLGWWDSWPWVLCSLRAGQGSSLVHRPVQHLASPNCTPFSISQAPFVESCLWASWEGFLIPYSKTADVSGCTTVCGPQSLLKYYKCWQSEPIPVAIWKN